MFNTVEALRKVWSIIRSIILYSSHWSTTQGFKNAITTIFLINIGTSKQLLVEKFLGTRFLG